MPTHSKARSVSPKSTIVPASRTASVNGTDVDLHGFEDATVVINTGAIGGGTWTPKLQEADDNGSGAPGTYADVAAADLAGGWQGLTAGDLAANTVSFVGYRGTKKWLRAVVTAGGSPAATFFSATVSRGLPARNTF
ncbi:MAG TPA: hypothetical protein VGR28_10620 [Candidatus Thermoplasmatota archaeon]|jgi:hypothetical protein|nr:hypothetical protein [Candidatus Thermoplasmatota archaeon]